MNEITVTGLSPEERQLLAIQATYRGQDYLDPRYYRGLTAEQRRAAAERWQAIADALYPEPWGSRDDADED